MQFAPADGTTAGIGAEPSFDEWRTAEKASSGTDCAVAAAAEVGW